MLVGLSKCLKQIIQMKLNRVKNPNWPEANQLANYKRDRGFEIGTTLRSPASSQSTNHSATLPHAYSVIAVDNPS